MIKIGLISDIHGYAAPLEEALKIFQSEDVSQILCMGDIAGYGTEISESVELLLKNKCTVLSGNHESWYLDRKDKKEEYSLDNYFASLPRCWQSVVEGVRVYAVHASPPRSQSRGIRLLDEDCMMLADEKKRWTGEFSDFPFEILIVGHTHQVFAEFLGSKLVVNPGSTKFNHSCAILTLPEKDVRFFPLSGEKVIKVWNWGMMDRL